MNHSLKFYFFSMGLLVLMLAEISSFAQTGDQKLKQLIAETDLYNMLYPQEKIYLHLDRPSYWVNDDLWYKIYVKDSPIPDCNLYVELINPSGTVALKNTVWVQHGLAYGDMHLPDTLLSGVYQLRAYTNWLRNFDDLWFYKKDIVIWNHRYHSPKEQIEKLKSKDLEIQFFPEGGTFVVNHKTRMGFKVADKHGKGIDTRGKITDKSGKHITEIKSDFKGIGSFEFTPEKGQSYKANLVLAGDRELEADLPVPQPEGITLKIDLPGNDSVVINIESNEQQTGQNFFLTGQVNGRIFYTSELNLSTGTSKVILDSKVMPGGIIRFTLFDNQMIPLCERLVFVKMPEVVNLNVDFKSGNYKPREKVDLEVKANDSSGNPCLTNLSLSVYNPDDQLGIEDHPGNIFTRFLLESELNGKIEEPGYYLKDDSLATLKALDNLMLTHGYRYFEWEKINKGEKPGIVFQPENSLRVTGKVVSMIGEKPVPGSKVTLMTLKSLLGVYEQVADSTGSFVFSDLFFVDTVYLSLRAVNPKGKRNVEIRTDDQLQISPPAGEITGTYRYSNDDQFTTTYYLSGLSSDIINRKWHVTDTILLGDINIVSTKQKPQDGLVRPYIEADFVVNMSAKANNSQNAFEAIEGKIPGVIWEESLSGFYARGERLLIYLDGSRLFADLEDIVKDMPSQRIEKVEYLKNGLTAGVNYPGGILFFYTARGKKFEVPPHDSPGMKSIKVNGYTKIRKFYSPQYESDQLPEEKNDFRNTIYWNPLVRTNNEGKAQVSFYNSDETGKIYIVVEGVSSDGKLCRGVAAYKVGY